MAKKKKKWSQDVTENSDAIASSLKRSAEGSDRRKSSPFRSAMSMLNFCVNRAGDQLTKKQKGALEKAKDELRKDFGRETRH